MLNLSLNSISTFLIDLLTFFMNRSTSFPPFWEFTQHKDLVRIRHLNFMTHQNLRLRFKLWQIAFEKYGIVLSGSFKNILIIASTFISVIPCYPWIRVQTSLPVSRYFRIQFLLTQFSTRYFIIPTRFPSTRYFRIQFSSTQFQSFSLKNEIA